MLGHFGWGRGSVDKIYTLHVQVLKDTNARKTNVGQTPDKKEKAQWKEDALVFLKSCLLEAEVSEAANKLTKKLERLSTFYLLHAVEGQLQFMGLPGFALYLPHGATVACRSGAFVG